MMLNVYENNGHALMPPSKIKNSERTKKPYWMFGILSEIAYNPLSIRFRRKTGC